MKNVSIKEIIIDICIATFRRPELLKILLESILVQNVDSNIKFRIVVVDNDKNKSAKYVIDLIKYNSPIEIIYDVEPIQNIALVRNRAVSLSKGKYVIFIDDDEIAEQNWLQNIINCALEYNADVVFAPVIPSFPINTSKWIIKGKFFERKRYANGTIINHGGTGNTLVDRDLFIKHKFLFDKNYGLTGGEDTALFQKIKKRGFKLIWCDDAIVTEVITPNRLTEKWILSRAFRGGQTFARVYVPEMSFLSKIHWFARRLIFILTCMLFLPISWLGGYPLMLRCLQKLASNTGQIMGLFNWHYQEYKL
jgi:succinoglycan biosynthesis protein ExoM